MEKVLLHSCCAPCSAAILEWMGQNGYEPTILFYNPNIFPEEEYLKRKNEIVRYAGEIGVDIVDLDGDNTAAGGPWEEQHGQWLRCAEGLETEPERGRRCLACFKHRLCVAAEYAAGHGFPLFTTTLASSRWKDIRQINEAGLYAEQQCGRGLTRFWDKNWRKGGLYERRNILAKQFYNQQYCGCEFTMRPVGTVGRTVQAIMEQYTGAERTMVEKGVAQAAALWRAEDGSEAEFKEFAVKNWAAAPEDRKTLFDKLSAALETFYGTSNQVAVRLQAPLHLAGPEPTEIDRILGAYDPFTHLSDDLFANKTAFITILNFPFFTLEEKNTLGKKWNRLEWAYARLGDVFTTRVPAPVKAHHTQVLSASENYIASYNIMMGHLLTEDGRRLFPEDMVLLSHWNLRDELKSDYAGTPDAAEKQEMIYRVMLRIVDQSIPKEVINDPTYDWAPYSNRLWKDGKEVCPHPETDIRYSHILETFHAEEQIDGHCPQLPTGIARNFEEGMEVSASDIERLFIRLLSSPEVKRTAGLIRSRLGRELRPYDIWYDGFKSRSTMSEDALSEMTRTRYPDAQAFASDMPRMLEDLGFSTEDARHISSHIVVEPARGSGHAWGAQGRWEPARLRTRISSKGMDYKGYNIAVHEFGHNVEQTLDLYDIDYYMLNGVPDTAFTEALAFIFQKRDLQLLGFDYRMDNNTTLDIFWGAYEIMGVALTDMYTWRWLYAHPKATATELREAVLNIAKDVWNRYYEPVLGTRDCPLLAVYSHMVNSPIYLPYYPFGHIIEYQLESHLKGCRTRSGFASELRRIYTLGRLTPHIWMQKAVGSEVSVEPLIEAAGKII